MLLADSSLAVLLTTAVFSLMVALQIPALTALTSRTATIPQGIAMGLSNSFVSLGRVVGPILSSLAFDVSIHLPYAGAVVVMLAGFVFSLRLANNLPPYEKA